MPQFSVVLVNTNGQGCKFPPPVIVVSNDKAQRRCPAARWMLRGLLAGLSSCIASNSLCETGVPSLGGNHTALFHIAPTRPTARLLVKSPVGVEKLRDRNVFLAPSIAAAEFFLLTSLSGGCHSGGCRLAEEAHESLEVLGGRCKEGLLTNKLHPTQAQATQSNQIFHFGKQRLHLLPLPLCTGECWCVR
jgi:hypothetical protein